MSIEEQKGEVVNMANKDAIDEYKQARQKEEEDLEAKGDKDTDGGALEKAAKPVKSFLEKIDDANDSVSSAKE